MRHRITSFRCVEAVLKMSLPEILRKTCNRVNYRHTSALRDSDAAILDHPANVRPGRNNECCKSRRAETDAPAARGDLGEQRIVGAKIRDNAGGRCVVSRGEASRLRARPHPQCRRCRAWL